jgi:indolepyruvate decarboxylase
LFGVPAAYRSPLFDAAIRQGMRTVVTASDLEAGYAADGYVRTKGLGAALAGGGPLR